MNVAEAEARLRGDYEFYARKALRIIDQRSRSVAFEFNEPQRKIEAVLKDQADRGVPQRAICLKARKLGVSTFVEGKVTHRYTTMPNHRAVVVAQDTKTAGELFEMSEFMYVNLPPRMVGELELKPAVVASRRKAEIKLGQASRLERRAGNLGLNSSLVVDTAGEVQAGRGFTYHTMHLSEVAMYPDEDKMTSLLNSVPDEPETLIFLESTANGFNFFRRMWKMAEAGESDYAPIFFPWMDDPNYTRPFIDEAARSHFINEVFGVGEYGEDEHRLREEGVTYEQLHWRRWAITNRTLGDLPTFKQEYPSYPDEAFLATGRQVFSVALVAKVLSRAERLTPDQGVLRATDHETRSARGREVEVPTAAAWTPREEMTVSPVGAAWWHRWAEPDVGNHPRGPHYDRAEEIRVPGLYIVGADAASGEETETADLDYHAIQVIDHRTLEQVARYRSRKDPDEVVMQMLLAALYYNRAWVAVEKTGGYGLSMLMTLWRTYHYSRLYQRRNPETKSEKQERRMGWDTNQRTKPLMVDRMKSLLREEVDGIADVLTAQEMMTYVRDEKGKMGADADAHDDLLSAYMIAQAVAHELPMRTFEGARSRPSRRPKSAVSGY